MINIAIATVPERSGYLRDLKKWIEERTVSEYNLFIACDDKHEGITINKNKIFRYFLDHPADKNFIFEDDCYPIKYGWDELFDPELYNIGLFLPNSMYNYEGTDGNYELYEKDGAMFMFLSRKTLETLGGFNKSFGKYGGEHSEFLDRAVRAGLIPRRGVSIPGTDTFIDGVDRFIHDGLIPNPRTPEEIRAYTPLVEEALSIYERESQTSPIYQEP